MNADAMHMRHSTMNQSTFTEPAQVAGFSFQETPCPVP